jgi:hypothetical protein
VTSPSCLVEGVRSGSWRRSAATATALVRGCRIENATHSGAWADVALCGQYVTTVHEHRFAKFRTAY